MSYPDIVEYNEAVQHPDTAFLDLELRQGKVLENNLGLPLALSGGFALTYMLTTRRRKLAVRCFHRQVPEAEFRYTAIGTKVKALSSRYFVDFQFMQSGIKVRNGQWPIVCMDWVEGDTLGVYLEKTAGDPEKLRRLRSDFQELSAFLEKENIAHGDIQNGNVMVANGCIRLIDYDGMYVPGLPIGKGNEVGHKHFQHPSRGPADYGPKMDRFSFIAVDLSLLALMEDSSLHRKFREGGETILFKANAYADPRNSELFRLLLNKPALKQHVTHFIAICESDIKEVPTLTDFLAGRNIPIPRPIALDLTPKERKAPARPVGYISPFVVVDAHNFESALKQVGNRVELIGKIYALKHGVGKRGRGRGRPWVFINFGHWRGNIVKLTIWSEGLSQLTEIPSEKWVGRWISVVGLIDPPYLGKHYAFNYVHVGITITDSGQINFLDENEAWYRTANVGQTGSKLDNQTILGGIKRTTTLTPTPAHSAASLTPASRSSNIRILEQIRQRHPGATPPVTSTRPPAPQRPSQPPSDLWSRISPWIWFAAIMLLLLLLSR